MIDWQRVNVLREEVGAEEFDEVVDLFLEEVESVVERLRTAPDLATLEEDLHFLKGSALSLGFASFSAQCQTGETLSADGKSETVDVAAILTSYDTSRQLFLAELPTALAG